MTEPYLVYPCVDYRLSFAEALREGLHLFATPEDEIRRVETDFAGWLKDAHDLSIPVTLPDGRQVPRVPQTTLWLLHDGRFLGLVGIRHALTEHLRKIGGHIFYAVRPCERKKGYGSLMLKHALSRVKTLGFDRVLLTCNDDNLGSIKIIEGAGGVLEDKIDVGRPTLHRRYWISIKRDRMAVT